MLVHNRTNVYDFSFHLVWTTKYRKQIFTTETLRNELKEILSDIAQNKGIIIEHMEVMSDYIHLMISFPPKLAPASVVKSLKGTSAREWFKRHPETKVLVWKGHLWTPSFFMSTLGNVSKEIVAEYIENQMKNSFETQLANQKEFASHNSSHQ